MAERKDSCPVTRTPYGPLQSLYIYILVLFSKVSDIVKLRIVKNQSITQSRHSSGFTSFGQHPAPRLLETIRRTKDK